MQVVKHYTNEFLNADDDYNIVPKSQCINNVNLRFGSTTQGAKGRWENIPSNAEFVNPYLSAGAVNIGKVSSDPDQYTVLFTYNASGSGIYLYFKPTATFYQVLLDSNINGGLNFSKYNLISAGIINGILYFTDNANEPRRVNIAACIKGNHAGFSPIASTWQFTFPVVSHEIALIRKPPVYPPVIEKKYDSLTASNNIKNESFQFAFYYIYYDGETSVLSPWSKSSFLNSDNENYNKIAVSMNASELVPSSVRIVRMVVKYGSTQRSFDIFYWDNLESTTPINNQNTGSPLSFDFYASTSGNPLDNAYSVKPFDDVALTSKCLTLAHNRVFQGNLVKGYDTPLLTSLSISGTTPINTSQLVSVLNFQVVGVDSAGSTTVTFNYSGRYVYLPMAPTPGYYVISNPNTEITSSGGAITPYTPVPASVNFSALTFMGATPQAVAQNVIAAHSKVLLQFNYPDSGLTITINGLPSNGSRIFKSGAALQLGIVFYDQYLRKCGVVTLDNLKYKIDDRNYSGTNFISSINWLLSNTNSINQIPSWAYYYQIVRTDNLKTRQFLQNISDKVYYPFKDANGKYTYSDQVVTSGSAAIAIDTTALTQAKMGYNYTVGDMCNIYVTDTLLGTIQYSVPVIGTDGKYILTSLQDLGDLFSVTILYEIYSPYLPSTQEPFYERGELLTIINPTLSSRTYSTLSGSIQGDVFSVARNYNGTSYNGEASCPTDKFWQRWHKNDGRINLVTKEGQVTKPTAIQFSNVYVQGTQTNGLSTFEPLNQELLDLALGPIQAMVMTTKAQKEGTVMLVIGTRQTFSIYIGETMVTNQDSTSYFVKSTGVISQINPLKGDFGTINPESVIYFKGDVWWFDALSARFVQYSVNGLDDISEGQEGVFKFARASALLARKFLATTIATMEGFGSRPFIFGGVNPHHKEIYWTFPQMDSVVPKGQLSDYVSGTPAYVDNADYPYDPIDYKGKTLVYKLGESRWMGTYSWTPEGFLTIGVDMYSLKNGKLYQHNQSGYNNFYGVSYRSKFMISCNEADTVKEFRTMAIESSVAPEWVHLRTEFPNVQSSDLIASDFTQKEGVFYADVYRDRLTPSSLTVEQNQTTGDLIRGKAMLILVQFNSSSLVYLREISIGYNQSSGHY